MNRFLQAMKAIQQRAERALLSAERIDDLRRGCEVLATGAERIVRWEISTVTLQRLAAAMTELAAYRLLAAEPPPMPTIWAAGVSPQVACTGLLRALKVGPMDLTTYNSDVKPLDGGEVHWAAGFIAEGQKYTVAGRGIREVIYTLLEWRSEPIAS